MIFHFNPSSYRGDRSPLNVVGPSAAFSFNAGAGLTKTFTDQSSAGTNPITTYSWDFGDTNTSTDQNPSHTYAAAGTYNVSLTVSDGTLQDVITQSVVVTAVVINPTDFDTMSARAALEGSQDRGGGAFWDPMSSASVADIINSQDASGRFALAGAIPAGPSNDSMRYWQEQWHVYNRKLIIDYWSGEFNPGNQGNATLRFAIFKSIKWAADTIPALAHFNRGTWTPYGWWSQFQIGGLLNMMADAFKSFGTTEFVDGERLDSIISRLYDQMCGMDANLNRDGTLAWTEANLTGSVDNNAGANGFAREDASMRLAVFVAKYNGDSTWLDQAFASILTKISPAYGLSYYENLGEWQDWVGSHPFGTFAAHNSAGAQAHLERYGYSLLRALGNNLQMTTGTAYEFPTFNFEGFMDLIRLLVRNRIRAFSSKRSTGRRKDISNPPSSSGGVTVIINDLLNNATGLTQSQRNELAYLEEVQRRPLLVPHFKAAKWYGTVGLLYFYGGSSYGSPNVFEDSVNTEYYVASQYGRRRIGDTVAGVATSEIQNSFDIHSSNPGVIILTGTDEAVGNQNINFNQYDDYIRTNSNFRNYPQALHGFVGVDNPTVETRAFTPLSENNNDEHTGADALDVYVIAGNYYHRRDDVYDFFKQRYWQTEACFGDVDLPGFTQKMGIRFDLKADIIAVNNPTDSIVYNVQYLFTQPVTYDFGGGQNVLSAGTDNTSTFSNVTNGWMWRPVDDGGSYSLGRGTIILGTHNLVFDCSDVKFRTMVDFGVNPGGANIVVIDVLRCTAADVQNLAQNISTYFDIVNTTDVQAVTYKQLEVTQMNTWTPGTNVTLEDGNTCSSDSVGSLIIMPNGSDYDAWVGWGLWRDLPAGGVNPLQGATISVQSKTPTFIEYGRFNITIDRTGPGQPKPPGEYYGPFVGQGSIT